jgi:YD repeat-containing protein
LVGLVLRHGILLSMSFSRTAVLLLSIILLGCSSGGTGDPEPPVTEARYANCTVVEYRFGLGAEEPFVVAFKTYDAGGRLEQEIVSDPSGAGHAGHLYAYDQGGHRVSHRIEAGLPGFEDGTVSIEVDGNGNVLREDWLEGDGTTRRSTLNSFEGGRQVGREILKAGTTTHSETWHYDDEGRKQRVEMKYGEGLAKGKVITFEYDGAGNVIREEETDADGDVRLRVREYDANGKVTLEVMSDNGRQRHETRTTYTPDGDPLEENQVLGRTTLRASWRYDARRRVTHFENDKLDDRQGPARTTSRWFCPEPPR